MVFSEAARTGTIETRRSWLVAWSGLGILCISLGAPLITVVALEPIAAEFGNIRSVPSLRCWHNPNSRGNMHSGRYRVLTEPEQVLSLAGNTPGSNLRGGKQMARLSGA